MFFLYILKNKFLKIENKNCYQTEPKILFMLIFLHFLYNQAIGKKKE